MKPHFKPINPASLPTSVLQCYCHPTTSGLDPRLRVRGWWWMVPSCERTAIYAANYGGLFFRAEVKP